MSKTIFYKCVKDFKMDDGDIVFRSGAIYPAEIDGDIRVRMLDVSGTKEFSHNMETDEDYFTSSFVELTSLDKWHSAEDYELERGFTAKMHDSDGGAISIIKGYGREVVVQKITLKDAKQFVKMLS